MIRMRLPGKLPSPGVRMQQVRGPRPAALLTGSPGQDEKAGGEQEGSARPVLIAV
jgi:hypothetical protein